MMQCSMCSMLNSHKYIKLWVQIKVFHYIGKLEKKMALNWCYCIEWDGKAKKIFGKRYPFTCRLFALSGLMFCVTTVSVCGFSNQGETDMLDQLLFRSFSTEWNTQDQSDTWILLWCPSYLKMVRKLENSALGNTEKQTRAMEPFRLISAGA